jgi:hypothetical protein
MAITPYTPDPQLLTNAATQQGAAVPALTKRVIKSAALVNTTAAPIPATVYLVPAGVAVGAANTLISARPIAAGETYPCPELVSQGLGPGGTVQALGPGLTFKYTATDFV